MTYKNLFIADKPARCETHAFVSRQGPIDSIVRAVESGTCSSFVLFGAPGTGKSTFLESLGAFLPAAVCIARISTRNPETLRSLRTFVDDICGRIAIASGEDLPVPEADSDLLRLARFLEACDRRLRERDRRLLLAIDDCEIVDEAIGENILPEDLLAMIRESIQTSRQIAWLFASGLPIRELPHVPWTSYLIGARTVEMPMFSLDETRQLLTDPMRFCPGSVLKNETPSFDARVWGAHGVENIHEQSGGWPVLVQWIASTAIDAINESAEPVLTPELFEVVLDRAVERCDPVFCELLTGSCVFGEWDYVQGFRSSVFQLMPVNMDLRSALRRSGLVVAENNTCRLRAPIMRRWLHWQLAPTK